MIQEKQRIILVASNFFMFTFQEKNGVICQDTKGCMEFHSPFEEIQTLSIFVVSGVEPFFKLCCYTHFTRVCCTHCINARYTSLDRAKSAPKHKHGLTHSFPYFIFLLLTGNQTPKKKKNEMIVLICHIHSLIG